MKKRIGLIFPALTCVLVAANGPAREHMEVNGWTIGFNPADRGIALAVAKKLPDFEKRLTALADAKSELGADELTTRAEELAKKTAVAVGCPRQTPDFKVEFERGAGLVRELDVALRGALFPHAVEVWRSAEVLERMKAGEQLPGFKWDPKENRPQLNFGLNWNVTESDFKLTKTIEAPPAIFVKVEKPDDPAAGANAGRDLENWLSVIERVQEGMRPTRLIGLTAIKRVVERELPKDPATMWVRAGLTEFAWREIVRTSLPPKTAAKYAVMIAPIPVGKAGDRPIDLEAWPEKDAEAYPLIARQVFLNIAEADGSAALAKLLEAFWQLPLEQRTSANLRRLYREQMKAGIEARAPRRSLGAVAK